MSEPAIITTGLTCYHGRQRVVDSLDLRVERGCIYGFLGRNGAGKTTVIRTILGLLPPTRGTGSILGSPITAIPPPLRERIGYVSERHPVYGWMRVDGWARFAQAFHRRWNERVFAAVLDHFRIGMHAHVGALSRGQQAGLTLATTLAPDPELLILDDPTLGLDPVARGAFLEAVVYLTRAAQRTVLFSSHQLADVERVADRIGVLENGALLADCSLDTFRSRIVRARLPMRGGGAPPAFAGLLQVRRMGDDWDLIYLDSSEAAAAAAAQGARPEPLSLEEAFTAYVGERGLAPSLLQRMGDAS